MEFVLLDFETTGFRPSQSEIIEVGAIKIRDFEIVDRFESLVRPEAPIPAVVTQLTGISQESVDDAPSWDEVAPELASFLGENTVVAHHAQMEQGFLDEHLTKYTNGELYTVQDSIDCLALSFPEQPSFSLDSLRQWAGLSQEKAHRALQDCEDTFELLKLAYQRVHKKDPIIASVVFEFLGESQWWWNPFFQPQSEASSEDLSTEKKEEDEKVTDLRKLKEQDTDRAISWELLETDEIHNKIETTLKDVGPLQGLEFRSSQEKMAKKVLEAITQEKEVCIEAPTGTGKSLAYLIPGILTAQKTGAPVVVSTHSKALQDQLMEKDIPLTAQLLSESPVKATIVKGQENYLCLRKLNESLTTERAISRSRKNSSIASLWASTYLKVYSEVSPSANIDRIPRYLRIHSSPLRKLLEQVKSHFTTTVGPRCPYYQQCHFFNSARKAYEADVIIANHSLLFHWPSHLPQLRNVIFDEAHHLENQITDSFSLELSERDILFQIKRLFPDSNDHTKLVRLIHELTLASPYEDDDPGEVLTQFAREMETRNLEWKTTLKESFQEAYGSDLKNTVFVNIRQVSPELKETYEIAINNLSATFEKTRRYFEAVMDAVDEKPKHIDDDVAIDHIKMLLVKIEQFLKTLHSFLEDTNDNLLQLAYWNPRDEVWDIAVSPIDVSTLSGDFFDSMRSIILTSATLTTGDAKAFVTSRIGVADQEDTLSLPTPYPLEQQAQVFIPRDTPPPGTPEHLNELIDATEKVTLQLNGRTLLLMTANSRIKIAAKELRERLKKYNIHVFDSMSDSRAAENFRKTEAALLIGSEKYGEGLDIPGPTLSCVVIEKINEAMTRGPLAEARKSKTQFGIYDYDFPLRMMWLKQRVGRLIRSPSDQGRIVIFDSRYHKWSGRSRSQVDRTLAPIPILSGTHSELIDFIKDFELPL